MKKIIKNILYNMYLLSGTLLIYVMFKNVLDIYTIKTMIIYYLVFIYSINYIKNILKNK